MSKRLRLISTLLAVCTTTLLCACNRGKVSSPRAPRPAPHVEVYAQGLIAPIGMAALADGTLVVAEDGTGERDDSAGVSLVTPDGQVGRFLSGLPSTRDSGDLAGASLVGLSPDGTTLYIGNFGAGHLWTYILNEDEQANGIAMLDQPLSTDDLGTAMARLNNVMIINPFDITFDETGMPVVSDATGNGVAKETADGATRFFHRFDRLPNPIQASDPIEAVPTGIERVPIESSDEYYVTLTGGCPYPEGSGQLVAIDEERNQRTVVDGLNMPIDVAMGPDGTIWLLEFARFTPDADCFSGQGYQVESGRLSRLLSDGSLETVLDGLNYPGAVLPMPDGSLYISEVFPGRILKVTWGEGRGARGEVKTPGTSTSLELASAERTNIEDLDEVLGTVIQAHGLQSNPGIELREGETAQARLGQLLFFDPILSGDKNISCATCHHPAFAMADGRTLPIGTGGIGLGPERRFLETVTLAEEADAVRRLAGKTDDESAVTIVANPFAGQFVPRNSPSILNSALFPRQFWDGRVEQYALDGTDSGAATVKTLERSVNDLDMDDPLAAQALFPVASLHEMAGATFGGLAAQTIRTRLLVRLRATPDYVDRFQETFGSSRESPAEAVTLSRLVEALAAFERRFIFTETPWDHYMAGDTSALSEQQKRGALLFFGASTPSVNCALCHSGDLFTDHDFHNILAPQLGPGRGHGYTGREDWGRAGVTFDARNRYAFRTPSLRNVTLTAPYFHDGAYVALEDAIRHHADIRKNALDYDPSAAGIPPDLYSSVQPTELARQWSTTAPELQQSLPLTGADIADLADFLESLTDPAATDLMAFMPDSLPSGLALDPLPQQPEGRELESSGIISSTTSEPAPTTLDAPRPPPPAPSLSFTNVAEAAGLTFTHGAFRDAIYDDVVAAMGGGLCWLDYDNDGWLDLYLVNSHAEEEAETWLERDGLPRNALFHNNSGVFVDVSQASGTDVSLRGYGCLAADFDNDGWTDLYITADGPNVLFWNNGDGTFSEGAAVSGVDAPEWNASAVAGDLNGDGWLDLYVAGYIDFDKQIPKPAGAFPQDYYGIPDRLYFNRGAEGEGRVIFEEITQSAGLLREERALGAVLSDLDLDGDLDLYIANDGHPNRLYANDPWPGGIEEDPEGLGFRFEDLTETADVGDSGSGMGVAAGDYDGDGLFDLFVTNWERELNALYRNETEDEGHLTFQYSTFRIGVSGLGNGLTGWGTGLADFDHDSDLDLLIANGRVPVTNLTTDPELVRYYRNRSRDADGTAGRSGQFLEWTGQVGLKEVGPLLSRGSAIADYDNDGDLDVAINQIAGPVVLLDNDLDASETATQWLLVSLDRPLPGTRVIVTLADGRELVREVRAGSSYLASEDPRLHFGLGIETVASQVDVVLPSGVRKTFEDIPAGAILHVLVKEDEDMP